MHYETRDEHIILGSKGVYCWWNKHLPETAHYGRRCTVLDAVKVNVHRSILAMCCLHE